MCSAARAGSVNFLRPVWAGYRQGLKLPPHPASLLPGSAVWLAVFVTLVPLGASWLGEQWTRIDGTSTSVVRRGRW